MPGAYIGQYVDFTQLIAQIPRNIHGARFRVNRDRVVFKGFRVKRASRVSPGQKVKPGLQEQLVKPLISILNILMTGVRPLLVIMARM